ncbi:MAG: hypothetical protein NTW86_23730 [Candidatus Sumerlaeota bacterium]|nr:hypothetical protein [Candidatus Sumerlaeota bacterium]
MNSESRHLPVLAYVSACLLLLLLLVGQTMSLRYREDAFRRETTPVIEESPEEALIEGGFVDGKRQELTATYGAARIRLQLAFLLLVAFPTAVLLPPWLARYSPPPPPKVRVVSARTMTLDDIGRGIPDAPRRVLRPETRLYAINAALFGVPAAILTLFPLAKPLAYGGPRTWLLFGVGGLLTFCGSAMAYPLKKRFESERAMRIALGAGFFFLGGIVWVFLKG